MEPPELPPVSPVPALAAVEALLVPRVAVSAELAALPEAEQALAAVAEVV